MGPQVTTKAPCFSLVVVGDVLGRTAEIHVASLPGLAPTAPPWCVREFRPTRPEVDNVVLLVERLGSPDTCRRLVVNQHAVRRSAS
jgi:hypothetical protein